MSNYLQIIFKCDLILLIFFKYFRGGELILEGTGVSVERRTHRAARLGA